MPKQDRRIYFIEALRQASKAATRNEVPIGAVIVKDGQILAKAHNSTERQTAFTAHAEMIAIQRAAKKLKSKYLNDCEIYVTLEPCQMCRYAARLSRLKQIHYLVPSVKFGRKGSAYSKIKVRRCRSSLTQPAKELLGSFFSKKR